ncbi:MAG: asparagine synthase (glutamine-hydrolyzing) [Flavobacteriales bacterium]|nr:asparagine synthase (glutamine-hydrolyzing) [Flavobacteriales bacterium]
MCGICGIVSFAGRSDLSQLQLMNAALEHRGPDGQGIWSNKNESVILGHRRLSIIDLSQKAKQPLTYRNERYSITYNGEIYNYIELKKELISDGYTFKSGSDTEVLLALYDQKGRSCLTHLDGMFAFAIWDNLKSELFCARDRFGEKPFYYTYSENKFYFASEMKAFWAAGIPREADNDIMYNYFVFGSIRDVHRPEKTFYKNVTSLLPAHAMVISMDGSVDSFRYWDLDLEGEPRPIELKDAVSEFQEIFEHSVGIRLRSDVAVGSSLSGGLDSSSIVSYIQSEKGSEDQLTFSAIFPGFEKDESAKIKELHRSYPSIKGHFVEPDINSTIDNFMSLVYHQDEPFGSFSISAQFEVMELAKNNSVKVLLDGQGADESLGGYQKYYETYLNELKRSDRSKYSKELKCFKEYFQFSNAGLVPKLQNKFPRAYKEFSSVFRSILPASSKKFGGLDPDIVREFKKNKPASHVPRTLKEGLYYSLVHKDLAELLRYADRNSMAHSVEVRLPFLSHKLVEFIFSLPNDLLIRDGWTKFILRNSMDQKLPRSIIWDRQKIGFEPPHRSWLEDDYFKDLIHHYVQKLIGDRIITKPFPGSEWKYLMLGLYLDKDISK